YRLIASAIGHGAKIVPVPGASAFVAALAASGLPTDSVHFGGFLPAKSGQRRDILTAIAASERTEVFYEAPHRLPETLEEIVAILGAERPVVVAREVTKVHEGFVRGRATDVLAEFKERPGEVKGEITLLIGKAEESASRPVPIDLRARLEQIMRER